MIRPRIELVEETKSTNELALKALSEGAAAGTVFVADHQTQGRGRRDIGGGRREWFSPKSTNLYLSAVIRPKLEMERLSAITLAVGVGLARVIEEHTGVDVWLKWPNDLYVGERKLGGVLTEGATGPGGFEGAVIGVGLNINVMAAQFPDSLKEVATSLRQETGQVHDRLTLALKVSENLLQVCDEYVTYGLEGFSESLERYDRLVGRAVEVREEEGTRRGVACGIGVRGGLNVEFEDGDVREIIAGGVVVDGLGGHSFQDD